MDRLKTIGLWIGAVVPMVLFFGGIFVYAWVTGSFLGAVCMFGCIAFMFAGVWVSVECSFKLTERKAKKKTLRDLSYWKKTTLRSNRGVCYETSTRNKDT